LRRVLADYVAHCNEACPHQGLDPRCPIPLPVALPRGSALWRNGMGGRIHESYREAA
jgi:hypothetical protein